MTFPMKNWLTLKRGFHFGEPTWYSNFHLGLDVIPQRTLLNLLSWNWLIAWQDLQITSAPWGPEGGNTIFIRCPNNKRLFRCMHLAQKGIVGQYKEGQRIGYVGNTGSLTTATHLHIDISKDGILRLNDTKNFEDPEAYFKMINGVK
jgi:murein DD-endopeptidase MepM/ murein hydrolase activator NlpD